MKVCVCFNVILNLRRGSVEISIFGNFNLFARIKIGYDQIKQME